MSIRPRDIEPAASAPTAPASRRRRAVAALALAGGLATAVVAMPGAATAAEARATTSVVVSTTATASDSQAHWTAQSRAQALATAAADGSVDATAASSVTPHPAQPFVGILFYVVDGQNRACTASVVDTPDGDAIATAAHCLVDRRTGQAVRLATFVPEAEDGAAPYGLWPVRISAVTPSWQATGRASDDAGFARVTSLSGARLEDTVGATLPVFGSPLVPAKGAAPELALLGYPQAAPYSSRGLAACEGAPHRGDGGDVVLPCAFGKGTDGSPVITFAGEQRSVVTRTADRRGGDHDVVLATWGAEAQCALASLHAR